MTAPIPPSGVDQLEGWLRAHRGQFTDEALRERLLAAGHPQEEVDWAFEALGVGPPPAPPSHAPLPPAPAARPWDPFIGFVAALFFVVGVPLLLLRSDPVGSTATGLGVTAFVVALVAWGVLRDTPYRGVSSGIGWALIAVVVLPVVAVVGIFGYCLVAGAGAGGI